MQLSVEMTLGKALSIVFVHSMVVSCNGRAHFDIYTCMLCMLGHVCLGKPCIILEWFSKLSLVVEILAMKIG